MSDDKTWVQEWSDQSGNGNHLIQRDPARQPCYVTVPLSHTWGDMVVVDVLESQHDSVEVRWRGRSCRMCGQVERLAFLDATPKPRP